MNSWSSKMVMIKKNIAEKQIETQNIRLATLNAISMTVNSSLDLKEVLNKTIDIILEILEPDNVRIYLLDEKNNTLNLVAHKGFSNNFIKKKHIQSRNVGDGLLGQTILTGKTKVVDNFLRSKAPYVDTFLEEGLVSSAYLPLISKEKQVGVMCVSSYTEFNFSTDYVAFLMAIGNLIGIAINNAHLYETTKKAYEELKKAQEIIIRTEKMASLGKLAATIAHEINNPLAAVLNYIKLMIKIITRGNFNPDRIEDIVRYLKTMDSETTRCGEIVKNLLAFSRQSKIHIAPYNIERIIDKTWLLIAHKLKINGIEYKKVLGPDIPKIKCDFKLIQQVLLNLLSNASEAMSNGGKLTVIARRSTKKNYLEIIISDTGCGISEQEKTDIFEPFFTTKEEGKGVGLGLSVAYGIIARHNGFIEIESNLGQGSRFIIFLPYEEKGDINENKASHSCG